MVLDGAARKIALIIVLISIIGWIAFVIGFGLRIHEYRQNSDDNINPLHEDYFCYWCFTIGAPFLYTAYFFHLYFNVAFTHYLSIFFTAIYFIAAGGVLYANGMYLAYIVRSAAGQYDNWASTNYYWIVELLGAVISVFFYWFSMMLWPCFQKNKNKGYYDY